MLCQKAQTYILIDLMITHLVALNPIIFFCAPLETVVKLVQVFRSFRSTGWFWGAALPPWGNHWNAARLLRGRLNKPLLRWRCSVFDNLKIQICFCAVNQKNQSLAYCVCRVYDRGNVGLFTAKMLNSSELTQWEKWGKRCKMFHHGRCNVTETHITELVEDWLCYLGINLTFPRVP